MRFVPGSWYHILMIFAPFVLFGVTWLLLRKKSFKVRWAVGVVIGVISLAILITRNLDLLFRNGFDPEAIPFQVCHFGSIFVFIALVFKSKIATATIWCVHLVPALFALFFVDAIMGYKSIFVIKAQAYIWGHIFIVYGALYAVFLRIVRFDFKHFVKAVYIIAFIYVLALFFNSLFNDYYNFSVNYFFSYSPKGFPFGAIYYLIEPVKIGWFTIQPVYVLFWTMLALIELFLMFGVYWLIKKYLFDKKQVLNWEFVFLIKYYIMKIRGSYQDFFCLYFF